MRPARHTPMWPLLLSLAACTRWIVPGDRPMDADPDWLPEMKDPWSRHPLDDGQLTPEPPGERPAPPSQDLGDPELLLGEDDGPLPTLAPPPPTPGPDWSDPRALAWAWDAFFAGRPDEALPVFEAVARRSPERADAWLGVGRCHLAQGDRPAARAALEEASRQDARAAPAIFYLGVLAYQEGDHKQALALMRDVERLREGEVPGLLDRDVAWLSARSWLELGDRARADLAFRRALELAAAPRDTFPVGPGLALERTADGALPGEAFRPVAHRADVDLGPGILYTCRGVIWHVEGKQTLKASPTRPSIGGRDLAPSLSASGELALVTRAPGRAGALSLVVVSPDGERRTLPNLQPAPLPPMWGPDGALYAVEQLGEKTSLARISLRDQDTQRVPLPLSTSRVAEGVLTPEGWILSVERAGGMKLALITPNGEVRWLTLRRAAPDPWRGEEPAPPEPTQPPSNKEPPAPAPPLLLEDPFTPGAPARTLSITTGTERPGQRPGPTRGAPPTRVEPAARAVWDPLEGDRSGQALLPRAQGPEITPREVGQRIESEVSPTPTLPSEIQLLPPEEAPAAPPRPAVLRLDAPELDAPEAEGGIPQPIFEPQLSDPEPEGDGWITGASTPTPAPLASRPAPAASGQAPEEPPGIPGDERHPSVSPRGDVAFSRAGEGRRRIWLLPADGSPQRVLTPPGRDCAEPSFSPDGRWLLYVCRDARASRLYVLELEARREIPLLLDDGLVASPTWVPPGAKVPPPSPAPHAPEPPQREMPPAEAPGAVQITEEEGGGP